MTTQTDEQVRADFEAWITASPYEKPVNLNPDSSGFPGQYRAYEVHLAWEAYQAGRAALQSQDREDAERYRWLCDKFGITKLPCAIERIIAGDVYVADGKAGIDEAIDHARRTEGENNAEV